jgi:Zn-finger nucleic acid-binding protein
MDCPACESSNLERRFVSPFLSGHQCSRCGGVWFSGDDAFGFSSSLVELAGGKPTETACPRCAGVTTYAVTLRSGVEALECPRCLGVWCESKGIPKLASLPPAPSVKGYTYAMHAVPIIGIVIFFGYSPHLWKKLLDMDTDAAAVLWFAFFAVIYVACYVLVLVLRDRREKFRRGAP